MTTKTPARKTATRKVAAPKSVKKIAEVPTVKLPKIPKSFGAIADLLYTTRENRLELRKAVDAMEQFEKDLKNHLINEMSKDDSGAAGRIARAQIVVEPQPVVEDWEEFYKHIKKKGEFDLLNRAVNRTAVRERWENGKAVPGVGTFNVTKVSVTKVQG